MNWDAIGAIGEIVGAAAVVVSIAYLAVQIRSNTRAMKASASFDATHSWAEFNQDVAVSASEEFWTLALRANDPTEPSANFSDIEKAKLGILNRALYQKLEGQYYLYKHGYLDAGLWNKRRQWARSQIELPFYREWWELEVSQAIYADEFVAALMDEKVDTITVGLAGVRPKGT